LHDCRCLLGIEEASPDPMSDDDPALVDGDQPLAA
jgi:hypothetical protein